MLVQRKRDRVEVGVTQIVHAAARAYRLPWAELMRRVFATDVLRCDRCGSTMSIIAVIPASPVADQILDHLGLEMPPGRATGPPA